MRPRAVVVTCLLLLAGTSALAATEPSIPYTELTLPNGLRVILSEDHRAPQVTVNVWYHVGAANQRPGRSGFAHLFEHMMFSGSQHVPDPDKVLAAIGAGLGGAANGSTNFDRTNYFETVPASQLPTALWIESDRMGFLLPTLDAKKLATQRDVVSNERRQRIENQPYGRAYLELCARPLPEAASVLPLRHREHRGDPGRERGGRPGLLPRVLHPPERHPGHRGRLRPQGGPRFVSRYFGDLPGGGDPRPPDVPQPKLDRVVEKTVPDPVARIPQLQMAWNGVKPFAPDEAAGDILAVVLGGSKTSRLYRRLVEEKQIASGVFASNASLGLGGYFQIVATARGAHTVAELRKEVEAVLDELRKEGPTPAEVERAKRIVVGGMVRSVERIAGKADQLNAYTFWTGDPGYLPKDVRRYREVTAAQVHEGARTLLPADRMVVLDVEPASAAAPGARP